MIILKSLEYRFCGSYNVKQSKTSGAGICKSKRIAVDLVKKVSFIEKGEDPKLRIRLFILYNSFIFYYVINRHKFILYTT
jgi:hypothetical protein